MKRIHRWLTPLVFCLLAVIWAAPSIAAGQTNDAWSGDRDMLLFWEAAGKIRQHSIHKVDTTAIVRGALSAYLKELDPYSQYLDPKQYRIFQDGLSAQYSGVGMELDRDSQGRYTCLPYPGGPADAAGIQAGDRLLKVDGKTVSELSPWQVVQAVRGKPGSKVKLVVRSGSAKPRTVIAIRATLDNETVFADQVDGISRLRITRFGVLTPSQLRQALMRQREADPLILDLRGNPGGDLNAAIDSAALLVPRGKTIVTIRSRAGDKPYVNSSQPLRTPGRTYIWQDQRTASAAEVFSAALTQNGAALSIGRTTFGKGMRQSVLELSDGSALILSDAYLIPPDGKPYHGHGLAPDREVKAKDPKDRDYLALTKPQQAAAPAKDDQPAQTAKARLPEIKVRLLEELPRDQDQDLLYIACFSKKYDTVGDGMLFGAEVLRSVDVPAAYLMKLPKEGRYLVCCGQYADKKTADQAGRELESLMKGSVVFTLGVTPDTLLDHPAAGGWGIRTGIYDQREHAIEALEKLRQAGLPGWANVLGYRSLAEARPSLQAFQQKGLDALWKAPCAPNGQCTVKYWVFVGPYKGRDDKMLEKLKAEGKVPQDALWNQL